MNLFKKNSTQNSDTTKTKKQGQIMNSSTEKKPIDTVKPEVKPESQDVVQKNSALVPKSEQAPQGIKK